MPLLKLKLAIRFFTGRDYTNSKEPAPTQEKNLLRVLPEQEPGRERVDTPQPTTTSTTSELKPSLHQELLTTPPGVTKEYHAQQVLTRYLADDNFAAIAKLALKLKTEKSTSPELTSLLYHPANNHIWMRYLKTERGPSGRLFNNPTAKDCKAFSLQYKLWNHHITLEDGSVSIQHPLDVLVGNYFASDHSFFAAMALNLHLARNFYLESLYPQATKCINEARRLWYLLEHNAKETQQFISKNSLNVPKLLKDETPITEDTLPHIIESLSTFTDESYRLSLQLLQDGLALNNLTAFYYYLVIIQAKLSYIKKTTTPDDKAQLIQNIEEAYKLIDQQLKSAEIAARKHPGAGNFMYGYAMYNVALLVNELHHLLQSGDIDTATLRQHPTLKDQTPFIDIINIIDAHNGKKFIAKLIERAGDSLERALARRQLCRHIEANGFPHKDGYNQSALINSDEQATTLEELLASYRRRQLRFAEAAAGNHKTYGCK